MGGLQTPCRDLDTLKAFSNHLHRRIRGYSPLLPFSSNTAAFSAPILEMRSCGYCDDSPSSDAQRPSAPWRSVSVSSYLISVSRSTLLLACSITRPQSFPFHIPGTASSSIFKDPASAGGVRVVVRIFQAGHGFTKHRY